MSINSDSRAIESLISPIIQAMGYIVWNIELHKVKRKTLLRVYVDVPVGDDRRSVTIDDCSKISSQIGALFDVENPIVGSYVLEVSSPGIKRSLYKVEHYERYIGSEVHIVLRQPQNERRDFIGTIQEVSSDALQLRINDEVITILLTDVFKANLIPKL